VVLLSLVAGSCSATSGSGAGNATTVVGGSAGRPATGQVVVSAAASLTKAFNAGLFGLVVAQPGLHVTYDFAGSNALATQILQGAPADVFASADQANMQRLVAAGLVDTPVLFARNQLEIAVAPGNPRHVLGLADLGRPDVSVVLEAPGVPAGDYARQALASAGVVVRPKSLETDVKSAITKVTAGEADAAVVYVTDVAAAGRSVDGVPVPDTQNVVATYPIAVVKATKNRAGAAAFVQSATSGAIQEALRAAGFLAP
jgi:molybdate transport system substrate-binding protein